MKLIYLIFLSIFGLNQLSAQVFNAESLEQVKTELVKNGLDINIENISITPVAGIFQLQLENGEQIYASKDGKHLFTGKLFSLNQGKGLINLSEPEIKKWRISLTKDLNKDSFVSFSSKEENSKDIIVFTDPECRYCRQFHQTIERLNRSGINVLYLPFPRKGVGSTSGKTLSRIWCSSTPQNELENAFKGTIAAEKSVTQQNCTFSLDEYYNIARKVGVRVTPSILLPNGELLSGFQGHASIAAKLFP